MRRSDIVSGAVLTVVGLITLFVIVPWQISGSSDFGIAPDVFPRFMAWCVVAFAVLLLASRLRTAEPVYEAPPIAAREGLFIAAAASFLVASYLAIDLLGFIAGGALSIALMMLAMGERRHLVRLILVSGLTPAAIWLAFWRLFSVPLP